MEHSERSRRKVLAALATGASAALVTSLQLQRTGLSGREGQGGDGEGGDGGGRTPEPTATPYDPPYVLLSDHGGVADGETDDTAALRKALDAAAPDGTVQLPIGDILIGSEDPDAITFGPEHRDVTLRGSGPARTRLKMAPGQDGVHRGVRIAPRDPSESGTISIRDLTLDGQGLEQNYTIGTGIVVESNDDREQKLVVSNCVIRDWAVNGFQLREPGSRIYYTSILQNGRKQEEATGKDGHGVSAAVGDNPNGVNLIYGCLMRGNTGAGADNGGGNMTIRESVIDDCGYGVKQNDTTATQIIENTRMTNLRTGPGIYTIPQDEVGGDLVLRDVLFEDLEWPAIDLPSDGTISGDRIVVRRTNKAGNQGTGVWVRDEGRTIDIGEMSVHGTVGGSAVRFESSTGSVDRLVHGNNERGVGGFSDVDVGSVELGRPLRISPPTAEEVGAVATWPSD